MRILNLKERPNIPGNNDSVEAYNNLNNILEELQKKDLSSEVIACINSDINTINTSTLSNKKLKGLLKQKQAKILYLVIKEHKIVPKNHYRNIGLALGMSAFGLPIGVAIGLSFNNLGLLIIGIPIGMLIGLVIGSKFDKKAFKEGRQLAIKVQK